MLCEHSSRFLIPILVSRFTEAWQCRVILPPIRGSQPEVFLSWCAHHHHQPTKGLRRPFERARHAHAPPTTRRRRVAGAPAARDLGAAATPLARRPLAT